MGIVQAFNTVIHVPRLSVVEHLRQVLQVSYFKIKIKDSLRTLRSNDATATRTSLKRWICVPSVFIAIIPTHLNFRGPYRSSKREIKFRRCLFTSSIKRKIRHFHVVVVQKQERNVQNSVMHVRSCCLGLLNQLFFWRSCCRPRRWILKSLLYKANGKRALCSTGWNEYDCKFGQR